MNDAEQINRQLAQSFAIDVCTTAPFAIGSVRFRKIGFAGIKVAEIHVQCPPEARSSVVPVVRQFVYRELRSMGLPSDILQFTPTVASGRTCMFVDLNEASRTKGKRKRGQDYEFHFEIKPEFESLFEWAGSQGKLRGA